MYQELNRMLQLGVIEESKSAWSSPIVLVKKANGKSRLCLDCRKLNAITKRDAYPLPLIDGLLSRLHSAKFITALDLKDAFWQLPLTPSAREKTAFTVPGRPLYQFTVMPFGLCNAPQSISRLMDKVIPHQFHNRILVYLDDLLVISGTLDEHFVLLKIVAGLLKDAGLTINLDKSSFVCREIRYLGFLVGEDGLKTDPDKVSCIQNFPTPSSVKQTRRLLGMAGWYRRFIPNYSAITSPITDLVRKGVKKFVWSAEAELAFQQLKSLLSTAPVLTNANFNKRFYIRCDACTEGIGSVLFQLNDENMECPIAYFSTKLTKGQKSYSTSELECLAAVLSVRKFRPYIEGYQFTIITDHAALKWLMAQKDLSGMLARWALKLQKYDFEIVHQKGSLNVVPDTLSRMFCDTITELVNTTKLCDYALDLDSKHFSPSDYLILLTKVKVSPAHYPNLKAYKEKVYIRLEPIHIDNTNDCPVLKLWVPQELTESLIRYYHDDPTSAHLGTRKTLDRIRRLYYWPRMRQHVLRYVGQCDICKTTKASNQILKPAMSNQSQADRPFQKIYIDLLGPYPRSKNCKTVILIVVDKLTKFVLLKALHKGTSKNIIEFLRNEVFYTYGTPETLLSDNGVQFLSKDFQSLITEFRITHIRTAIYSPQANASERINRTIISAIRAYINKDHRTWDTYLGAIAGAIRNAVHESTLHSPHFALFGNHRINHGNEYRLLRDINSLNDYSVEVDSKPDKLNELHQQIRKNLNEAYKKYSHYYNLRSRDVSFTCGQTVFVRNFTHSDASKQICGKFEPRFVKGKINRVLGKVNYEIIDEMGKILGIFHTKDIKT